MTLLLQPRGGLALPHSPRAAASPRLSRRLGQALAETALPSSTSSLSSSSSFRGFVSADGPARRRGPRHIEAHRWLPGLLAAAVVLSSSISSSPAAASLGSPEESQMPDDATLADVPQTLSGGGEERRRIQKPKSRQAESCTVKCLGTCIRGGAGSPGEGPFNIRRPLVVFKSGFRSRNYCLVECSDICNLIKDGEDGP